MSSSGKAVAQQLSSEVASLTYNRNLFVGPTRPVDRASGVPVRAVFCLPTSGAPPQNFVGMTTSIYYPSVQVRVRGSMKDFEDGLTLARQCLVALHKQPPTGYIECLVAESEPNYVGEDDDGHPEWTINVELRIRE